MARDCAVLTATGHEVIEKTGEPLQIAARKTVKFTVGKAFKDAVNK